MLLKHITLYVSGNHSYSYVGIFVIKTSTACVMWIVDNGCRAVARDNISGYYQRPPLFHLAVSVVQATSTTFVHNVLIQTSNA